MMLRGRPLRLLLSVTLLGSGALAARAVDARLPRPGFAAVGLRVDGEVADGRSSPSELVGRAAERRLDRRVTVRHRSVVVLESTLRDLGGTVDTGAAEAALERVGRSGTFWERLAESERARRGDFALRLRPSVPTAPLASRLDELKQATDTRPSAARLRSEDGGVTPHVDGVLVDLETTTARLAEAALRDDENLEVELAVKSVTPGATTAVVAALDHGAEVGVFETRFAFHGRDRGRAQNVARAAEGIDGAVLMPGEEFSFNDGVGPRSVDNGFAQAGEIYKGEMRLGVGGGTCQVASTLHAAAFFGGLEIVARSPHSRPSAYIRPGLDATVVYPEVDLRLRNPFDFPIVVRARAERGLLRIALLGERRMATVHLATGLVRQMRFGRKIERTVYLAPGKFVRKQSGRRGMELEKVRTIRFVDGRVEKQTTRDVYPPTTEIYQLGPGVTPADLPPLEDGLSGPAAATPTG